MGRRTRFCIQRLLPDDSPQPDPTRSRARRSGDVLSKGDKRWPNGAVLRVALMGGTPEEQAVVRTQALWWSQHANLAFAFADAPDADLRVGFDRNECAWSYVGTDAKQIPPGLPTMNLGFLDGGIAAHAFGHAIGLGHVGQNPAAGAMEWNEAALVEDLSGPPMHWAAEEIRSYIATMYGHDRVLGSWFDPQSIMLPMMPKQWNGVGMTGNATLSANDGRIAAKLYPRR